MLDGIRIVEIEGLGPGPFAGMLLADLGAEVIVIHRPGGNPAVNMPEAPILDRGKRSIELDLKSSADLNIARKLIARADGLIEGFRPGVMERLGLGPMDLHAQNPALVYGRMTGWGQSGPLAETAGHDLNYIGISGALFHASPPGTPPMTPPTLVGDIGGGALYLVVGLLAGLLNARATGTGTVVDAAICDGSAHMLNLLMMMGQTGAFTSQRGGGLLDGPHWSRTYQTSDGGYMSVQCLEPKFYADFLARLGLSDDPDFSRQFDADLWPDLSRRLTGVFTAKTRAEWTAIFDGSDACVGPVLAPHDAPFHPHNAARGTWIDIDGALQAAPAPRFDGHTQRPRAAPRRGADGADILAELGISPE